MSFSELLRFLRESYKGIIIFINSGAFYIAVEEDAVLLNNKLKLKCSCFQKNTCKVGVPINSLNKYLEKIEKLGYAYIVYKLDREKRELDIVTRFEGKKNKIERKNINLCYKNGKTAKAILKLELRDKTKLELVAYNEIADYAFRNLKVNDSIFANGKMLEDGVVSLDVCKLEKRR